jgi:hypothetical protein
MPLVFGGLGIALPKTLGKIVSAQVAEASGCLFFWILFFGQAKKAPFPVSQGIAVVGPRTVST